MLKPTISDLATLKHCAATLSNRMPSVSTQNHAQRVDLGLWFSWVRRRFSAMRCSSSPHSLRASKSSVGTTGGRFGWTFFKSRLRPMVRQQPKLQSVQDVILTGQFKGKKSAVGPSAVSKIPARPVCDSLLLSSAKWPSHLSRHPCPIICRSKPCHCLRDIRFGSTAVRRDKILYL